MRGWVHALCVIAGIAAPISLEAWTTSAHGPRNKAHYAAVEAESMTPKEVVLAFDRLAFDDHKPVEAIMKYVAPDYVDHDPTVKGDRQSAIDYLEKHDWSKGGPQRTIKHVIAEGDLVVLHHHLVRQPGTKGLVAVDIFRVKDGKLAEHWDALQPIPDTSINTHGPF
ncbi:MAG TPA: nuclear transport factor 2 family protein [Sphingomonadaceae bacterium]|jgi:predicted SnoaL-like aldol condensation-catalyzing enzyme|nr:nuclear transport factor 2 family protein [Sphingomonadaceae bacterium]